jgi:hypothetical protein
MIHKVLRSNAQEYGGFTDLFILGTFRRYNAATKTWGSDFTGTGDATYTDTTQAVTSVVYNLFQLTETLPAVGVTQAAVPRYMVGYPLAMAVVKYPFKDTDGQNNLLQLGVAGSLTTSSTILTSAASALELQDNVIVPAAAAVPLAPNVVAQWLTATITPAAGALSASSVGGKTTNPAGTGVDIWIYVCLLPAKEWVYNREA